LRKVDQSRRQSAAAAANAPANAINIKAAKSEVAVRDQCHIASTPKHAQSLPLCGRVLKILHFARSTEKSSA
jgi:hypothetical protein